jgi:hypothetical protein
MLQAHTNYTYKHPDIDSFGIHEVKIKLYAQEAHFSIKDTETQLLYYQIVRFDYPITQDAFLYYLHKWIALEGINFSSLWLIDFQSKFLLLPKEMENFLFNNEETIPQKVLDISKSVNISIPDYNPIWQSTREKFNIKTSHFLELLLPFCESVPDKSVQYIVLEVMPDSFCFVHFNKNELMNVVYQSQCSVIDILYFLLQYCNLNNVIVDQVELKISGILHSNGPILETFNGFFQSPKIIVDAELNEFALLDHVFLQEL